MKIIPKKQGQQFNFSGARKPRIVRRGADAYDPQAQTYTEGRGKDYGSVQNPSGILHSSLSGLSNDDHTQYLLADGSRSLTGSITIAETANLVLGTTTGTKIGTATTQKLGFFNATPIVQPANSVSLETVLSNLGLRASGASAPLSIGILTIADASNIVIGTSIGTKIGTAASQKISLWNATPIVQPTTAIAASTFVSNTSGTLNDSATWDGYTIGQVVKALRNIGALA